MNECLFALVLLQWIVSARFLFIVQPSMLRQTPTILLFYFSPSSSAGDAKARPSPDSFARLTFSPQYEEHVDDFVVIAVIAGTRQEKPPTMHRRYLALLVSLHGQTQYPLASRLETLH
jgi:hypothetical protein